MISSEKSFFFHEDSQGWEQAAQRGCAFSVLECFYKPTESSPEQLGLIAQLARLEEKYGLETSEVLSNQVTYDKPYFVLSMYLFYVSFKP